MIYTIEITVYLVSVWLVWRFMRIAHSKGGRWEELNIGVMDLTMVFIPFLNTIFMFLFYILVSPRKKSNRIRNFNNLFKVKK
jgi:hypothetical protein